MATVIKPSHQKIPYEVDEKFLPASHVVAADAGNGEVTGCRLIDGKLQTITLPNMLVEKAKIEASRGTEIDAIKEQYVRFGESWYVVGRRTGARAELTFANSQARYGSQQHTQMVLVALGLLQMPHGKVTMFTNVPASYYNTRRQQVADSFAIGQSGDGDGWWRIEIDGHKDRTEYRFPKKSVRVYPEGYGVLMAYSHTLDGQPVLIEIGGNKFYLENLNTAVIDGGFGTLDRTMWRRGELDLTELESGTSSTGGVMDNMARPVLEWVQAQFRNRRMRVPEITVSEADGWLRAWAAGGFKSEGAVIRVGTTELNFHDYAEDRRRTYANTVIADAIESSVRAGAQVVVLGGGGIGYVADIITSAYKREKGVTVLVPKDVPHIKSVPLWHLQAVGLLASAGAIKRKKST